MHLWASGLVDGCAYMTAGRVWKPEGGVGAAGGHEERFEAVALQHSEAGGDLAKGDEAVGRSPDRLFESQSLEVLGR